jgi:hypothetical protein
MPKLKCYTKCKLCNINHFIPQPAQCKTIKQIILSLMRELLEKTPKDKTRKVCKNCHELGHNIKDTSCKINIEKNSKLREKIKKYMLVQDCLVGKTNDEHFEDLSKILGITPHMCKTLYDEISPIEMCHRPLDMTQYAHTIKENEMKCHECSKCIYNIHANTNRIWKGNTICDTCWSGYEAERDALWLKIADYKKIQCFICCSIKTHHSERYHFDHINMFDKSNSICSMVNDGIDMDDICKEVDKCQVLCLTCHHIVTDIESSLKFTQVKQILTRKLNND